MTRGYETSALVVSRIRGLAAAGFTRRQIARELGVARETVRRVQENPALVGHVRHTWRCRGCGGLIEAHVPRCLKCALDRQGQNRRLAWIGGDGKGDT